MVAYVTGRGMTQPMTVQGFTYATPITWAAGTGSSSNGGNVKEGSMRMRIGLAMIVLMIKGGL